MELAITEKGTCAIITPGEDVLLHNSSEFKNHINSILEKTSSDIVIDLSKIRYADSALIASLIFATKKAQMMGKECVLMNVPFNLLKILQISQIDGYFKICKDEHEINVNSAV